jgi:hypothetical protein
MRAIVGILLMVLCLSTVGFSQETNTYYNGEDTIEYIGEIYGIDKFTYEDSLLLKELVDTFKLDFSEMEYLPSNTDQYVNFIATITNSYYHKTIGVFGEFIHFEENKYIKRRIDLDAINSEFVEGSLPHILLSELFQEDPDGMSTQKAFEAIKKNN